MPLPTPGDDETQSAYMARCMHELSQSDTDRPQDQRVAICLRAWREGQKTKFVGLVERVTTIIKGALS